MMSNAEIVEIVYKEYKIKNLIKKMINYSVMDNSHEDLEQYIYEYLLKYNNITLNQIYNDKKLRNFIAIIIKNQRNCNSCYKDFRMKEQLHIVDYVDYLIDELEDELDFNYYFTGYTHFFDFINKYSIYNDKDDYSEKELINILSVKILNLYVNSNLTYMDIARELGVSKTKMNQINSRLKKIIKEYSNEKFFEKLKLSKKMMI